MSPPKLTREMCQAAVDALAKYGSQVLAARAMGISRSAFQHRLAEADMPTRDPDVVVEPLTSRERFDAAFWRKKAADAQRAADEAEHVAEQLAGIRGVEWSIPEWIMAAGDGDKGRSVIGCLVSDMHMGEVIDAEEMSGVNAFNPDICRERMRRYFEAACIVGKRWAADTHCEGALLALGGDQVSGSIHDELAMTNALTSPEQVIAAVEVLAAGIIKLRLAYNRVHVVSVPGNHGRTTHKSTAKLYSRLSYDTMIAAMLADRFRGDKNITFQYGPARDQIVPVFGRTVFLTHGDAMGTGGGHGFAGPMLPIIRGTKKVEAQQARFGRRPDLILHGHFHSSGNAGAVLSNGALPGNSEYGSVIRASPEPPRQWLFLLHDKWWLRERADIMLTDPDPVEKPRVRVPAWS
jgi:hypothetical protein